MPRRRSSFHEQVGPLVFLLGVSDVLGVGGAGLLALPIANALRTADALPVTASPPYMVALGLAAAMTMAFMSWLSAYRPRRGMPLRDELGLLSAALVMVFLCLGGMALAAQAGGLYSRVWVACWFALSFGILAGGRVVLRTALRELRRRGFDSKRIVLVGEGPLASTVAENLKRRRSSGFEVIGYFGDDPMDEGPARPERLGGLEEVEGYVDSNRSEIDQLWIAMPLGSEDFIARLLQRLRSSTVDIRLVPDMFAFQLLNYSVDEVAGVPVLNLSYSPFSGPARYLKHAADKIMALVGLAITAPVMGIVAAAVKLSSPGPIIFAQLRHGWDGRPITVYKFRTMRNDRPAEGFDQARRDDPRVTRVGAFLRRTSLDELPQLVNVLLGDMSLVGPRPHPLAMNERYSKEIDRYMLRHKVKPGITGWAQANGYRGATDSPEKIEKRLEYDLYYIEHWSFWFDLEILFLTLARGLFSRNAY